MALTVWRLHRWHAWSGPSVSPFDDDEEHPHSVTAVPLSVRNEKGLRILMLPMGCSELSAVATSVMQTAHGMTSSQRRTAASTGRGGCGGGSSSDDLSACSSPHGSNAVTASLRNLARSTSRVSHSQDSTTAVDWEKHGSDKLSPEVTLMADGLKRDHVNEIESAMHLTHDGLPERTGPSHRLIF